MSVHRPDADEVLVLRRRELRGALEEVQEGFRATIGLTPRTRSWLLPLLAASIGVVAGMVARRRTAGRRRLS